MIQRPCWKSFYQIEVAPPDAVLLASESHSVVIDGAVYARIAPLLDGSLTVDEIADRLAGKVSLLDVYRALILLEKKGYIAEAQGAMDKHAAAFWEGLDVPAHTAPDRWAASHVSVEAVGTVSPELLLSCLTDLHIPICRPGHAAPSLAVLWTDDYARKALAQHNQKALASKMPWMLVKASGTQIWIGPIFLPGKTACWECLASRLSRSQAAVQFARRHQKGDVAQASDTPGQTPLGPIAADLAALEIARWVAQGTSDLEGKILSLDLATRTMEQHQLVKRPQCPACGDMPSVKKKLLQPITLAKSGAVVDTSGGYRVARPEETYQRLAHHISPITGIVTELRRAGCEESGLTHTYWAGTSFAHGDIENLNFLRKSFRNGCTGKGVTEIQAKVGGLCEAIERSAGIYEGYEGLKKARYVDIQDQAIHPNACLLFSRAQYSRRGQNNRRCHDFHVIPDPFDEKALTEWTPVWSLTEQKFKYLPTTYCYFDYPKAKNGNVFAWADSNGCASGNTIEEAILQGFLELVERDAVALWWYNRLVRPGVDFASFQEPYLLDLVSLYRKKGFELWALDITSDLGIPVYVTMVRSLKGPGEKLLYAFGAHFDSKIALLRSVTEMNQCQVWLVRDTFNPKELRDDPLRKWFKKATLKGQPYLAPDTKQKSAMYDVSKRPQARDISQEVSRCVQIAKRAGLEVLVLNQTRPDMDLPVARVIVPGMRHFWPRFAPGRLYEVPVKMGWLKKPLREKDLNPWPIYL